MAAAAGESGGGGGPSNRKRPRAGTGVQLKSEGDIAERLLTAVAGGGKGTADRFFRKAMKLAVDKQYDQSRAGERKPSSTNNKRNHDFTQEVSVFSK